MVFSIAHAFSIIRPAWITVFFCLLAALKTDAINEYTGIKGHLVLIKTKTFQFKNFLKLNIFSFFCFFTRKISKNMNLWNTSVQLYMYFSHAKFFPKRLLQITYWEVIACLEIAEKMSKFIISVISKSVPFFPYLFLLFSFCIFNIFRPLFSLCPCLAYFSLDEHVTCDIRPFMRSKSKRINHCLYLSISVFDMVDTARVCSGLYFHYFLRISHLFDLLEQQTAT